LLKLLRDAGFEKITFAGGEPTLCPWLEDAVKESKRLDFTTNIVTNGTLLDERRLDELGDSLDWITFSVDSISETTNLLTGRAVAGRKPLPYTNIVDLAHLARSRGVRIKLNTVVTAINKREDLRTFIEALLPERWKVLRYLEIRGENDSATSTLAVSREEFRAFLFKNQPLPPEVTLVPEDNDNMIDSYVMVDPLGRFIDNSKGMYTVSDPVLQKGVTYSLAQIKYSYSKFIERGGKYD
jgi:radical S-adenosyl methionine domain-containing protein 2